VATAVLEAERAGHRPQLFGTTDTIDLGAIEDEISSWVSNDMRLITVLDSDYPENLRGVHNRPPDLCSRVASPARFRLGGSRRDAAGNGAGVL
jgi:predicted Rossmann fold nucleotide-binding protein DprA/Smf involved in DNA uptake